MSIKDDLFQVLKELFKGIKDIYKLAIIAIIVLFLCYLVASGAYKDILSFISSYQENNSTKDHSQNSNSKASEDKPLVVVAYRNGIVIRNGEIIGCFDEKGNDLSNNLSDCDRYKKKNTTNPLSARPLLDKKNGVERVLQVSTKHQEFILGSISNPLSIVAPYESANLICKRYMTDIKFRDMADVEIREIAKKVPSTELEIIKNLLFVFLEQIDSKSYLGYIPNNGIVHKALSNIRDLHLLGTIDLNDNERLKLCKLYKHLNNEAFYKTLINYPPNPHRIKFCDSYREKLVQIEINNF